MILQAINNIAEICARHEIETAVLSPGSRCAPITLAFTRYQAIKCYTISDERTAAFVALGMAQATKKAVVLVCTSGSAALNYAPAVAEAYFQQTPLLILTADRPPEWIDQWDGQTIRQQNIYGQHVKRSFQFPTDLTNTDAKKHAERIVNEAILAATSDEKGPVHINIPLREPFYPEANETWQYESSVQVIKKLEATKVLSSSQINSLTEELNSSKKPIFVIGQGQYEQAFLDQLSVVSGALQIPILSDVIANAHTCNHAITVGDAICTQLSEDKKANLSPDLIISFGKSIISKNLKLFLRKSKAKQWHVSPTMEYLADPFQAMSKLISCEETHFLASLQTGKPKTASFFNHWKNEQAQQQTAIATFFQNATFSEFKAVNELMRTLPQDCYLHLANSMSVRYANFVGLQQDQYVQVWANRGTSGIDGSTSTAMGHALANPEKQHVLITGDVAFFYDRNAFWHNYPATNLKILLLNNQGGTIFGMIKGPREQQELKEYFETRQTLNAASLANEFGIEYLKADNEADFQEQLNKFLTSRSACILEVMSDTTSSQVYFEEFKKQIK